MSATAFGEYKKTAAPWRVRREVSPPEYAAPECSAEYIFGYSSTGGMSWGRVPGTRRQEPTKSGSVAGPAALAIAGVRTYGLWANFERTLRRPTGSRLGV